MGALQWDDGTGKTSNDTNLGVHFELRPKKDEGASLTQGRPIFADVEYVEIFSPGDPKNIVCKPVTDEHRRRFAPQYAAFKASQQTALAGTPLEEWPTIAASKIKELAYFKVSTVEQLVAMTDEDVLRADCIELVARARDYLAAAKGNAPLEVLRAQVEKYAAINATQKRQLEQQAALLQANADATEFLSEKPRRGRPPGKKSAAKEATKEAAP